MRSLVVMKPNEALIEEWEKILGAEGLAHCDVPLTRNKTMIGLPKTRGERTNKASKDRVRETEQYYYVIGTYIQHAPLQEYELKYRELLVEYSLTGNMIKQCKKYGYNRNTLSSYISRNFKKMLEFTLNFDRDSI